MAEVERQQRLKQAELQETKTRFLRQALEGSLRALPALTRVNIERQIGPVPDDDVQLPFWCVAFAKQRDISFHYAIAFGDKLRNSHAERLDLAAAIWHQRLEAAQHRSERRAPAADHGDGAQDE